MERKMTMPTEYTEYDVQRAVEETEWEIAADANGVDVNELPGYPFAPADDRTPEMVEGWDGALSDEEIAHRNIYGDHNGETVTDRPLELAEELSYKHIADQKDAELAQLREHIAQLETLADPGAQQRAAQAREDMIANMIANPEQTLAYIGELQQRVQQQGENRVNASMTAAHREHGRDFEAAYRDLTSLDPQSPLARATVQEIINSPDPGRALLQWHGGSRSGGRMPPFMAGSRGRGVNPPSLNTATRGGRSREPDLADMDGGWGNEAIEDDIMRYATIG
jgi:hypothetical protein